MILVGKYPIINLPFRQLPKVVGNFANGRIHYGETKSLLANFRLEIRQIGEFYTRDSPIGQYAKPKIIILSMFILVEHMPCVI